MVMTQCEHCKEEVEVNMFYHDSRITSITASIFHHQYYTAMVEGRFICPKCGQTVDKHYQKDIKQKDIIKLARGES